MTPKEKAKELVDKFRPYTKIVVANAEYIEDTKQCALIAVDEILNDDWYITTLEDNILRKKYWQEVKTEIQLL